MEFENNDFNEFFTEFQGLEPPKGYVQDNEFKLQNVDNSDFLSSLDKLNTYSNFSDISFEFPGLQPPSTHTNIPTLDFSSFNFENMFFKDSKKEKSSKTSGHKFNDRKSFVNTMYNAYKDALGEKGLDPNYALALVAQDAIETNYGKSVLGNFNYGNITTNGDDWHKQTGKRKWKDFKSLDDYVNYKIKFLGNKRYRYFQTFTANSNIATAMQVLANRGYDPGNPNYGKGVAKVYNDLQKYLS